MACLSCFSGLKPRRVLRYLAALVAYALQAGPAVAVERQHHIGVAPGLGILATDKSKTAFGATLGAFYTYGLTDQFNLLAEGSIALHEFSREAPDPKAPLVIPKTRPSTIGTSAVGVAYVLDVLRYVPYFGVLVGANFLGGGTTDQLVLAPSAQLALGLDYQFSRSFAMGIAFRQHMMLTKLATYPSYTTVFLKAEFAWGY
jgi:hypothetical protein